MSDRFGGFQAVASEPKSSGSLTFDQICTEHRMRD